MNNSIEFLNQTVVIKIDKPLGSKNHKYGFVYPVNYGYIPNSTSNNVEKLDAYILGVYEPLEYFTGKCIAVIHRINDNNDKLIVVPENRIFTDDEIKVLTEFQERFFESQILRLNKNLTIRLANYSDCNILSLLKKEIWETTYRGIYPDEKIDNYNYIESEKIFKNFIDNPQQHLYVILDNNQIIGYFEFGIPFRPFKNYKQEIGLFYIKKDYQRSGIGKTLFYFAFNYIKNTGVDKFFISCHKYNLNAQKFYEKMGGKIVQIDDDSDNNGLPHLKYEYTI